MLVLSRMPGQSIVIGKDIEIVVTRVQGNKISIGIAAPKEVKILRKEISRNCDEEVTVTPSVCLSE